MGIGLFPLVGIDIGTSAIKVIELTQGRLGRRKLQAMGLELLPNEVVVDGLIQDEAALEKILRELLERLNISTSIKRAAIAISGSTVQVKRVTLDSVKSDIAEQINYEAEQHLQMDMADIYFRYQEVEGFQDRTKVPVMMVGAQRETVEQYTALVRNVGLRTGVIDCDPFCLSNMFEFNYRIPNALVALIDVGAAFTRVVIQFNGQCLYTRELSIGGNEYTRQIMENQGVDFTAAETMKLSVSQGSGGAPPAVQKIIADINEILVKEIFQAIEFYFQNTEPVPGVQGISYVFIAGGGARTTGLDAAIAGTLQVPVQMINPFNHISVNPKQFDIDYILMQGHLYGVALGLAIRSMGDQPKT